MIFRIVELGSGNAAYRYCCISRYVSFLKSYNFKKRSISPTLHLIHFNSSEEFHMVAFISDPPKVRLSLGSSINPESISEGNDVYMDCEIRANPKAYKVEWSHNVRNENIIFQQCCQLLKFIYIFRVFALIKIQKQEFESLLVEKILFCKVFRDTTAATIHVQPSTSKERTPLTLFPSL